jgi:hypothetical protein
MKGTGEPERLGEVRYQAGATATAVHDQHRNLIWEVTRQSDGLVRTTHSLAQVSHWKAANG